MHGIWHALDSVKLVADAAQQNAQLLCKPHSSYTCTATRLAYWRGML